jgi:6-pyruvoyltetrahydropterin/6-carboxytetrahydropterin synthase
MTTRIGKVFRFEAAHHLPQHDGKCRNPHGHSYRVELTFVGELEERGPQSGMVIDFGEIAAFWKRELEPLLDHQDLNETLDVHETTAEQIARWLYRELFASFGDELDTVRVWETADAWAEYPA